MTSYPINYSYDRRDGSLHEGFAESPEQAIEIAQANREGHPMTRGETKVTAADLDTCEVGTTNRSRSEFEKAWAEEIEAGWVSVIHVYGGYKGEATFWRTVEEDANG